MKNRRPREFYTIGSLGSSYCEFLHYYQKWFCRMTLNRKSAATSFLWSSKHNRFQTTWIRTKIQWFNPLKIPWIFLATSWYSHAQWEDVKYFCVLTSAWSNGSTQLSPLNSNIYLLKELRHPFSNVYSSINLIFLESVW